MAVEQDAMSADWGSAGWMRTSQVVGQVLDGALAGDDGLHEESEHGEHSQTAVLDLLGLRKHHTTWSAPRLNIVK